MKLALNLSTTLLAFAVSIAATTISHAFREPVRSRAVCGAHVSQAGEELNESQENRVSEDEDAGCLNADLPRPRGPIVSFGVLNTRAIELLKPVYPEGARSARISGEVRASIVVDEKGHVIRARISGHPLLQSAVRSVVCRARFEPVRLGGHPVKFNGFIVYNFILE